MGHRISMPDVAWKVMHTGIPEVQTVPYEQAAPNLRSVIVVESGHFMQWGQPELLTKTLLNFPPRSHDAFALDTAWVQRNHHSRSGFEVVSGFILASLSVSQVALHSVSNDL